MYPGQYLTALSRTYRSSLTRRTNIASFITQQRAYAIMPVPTRQRSGSPSSATQERSLKRTKMGSDHEMTAEEMAMNGIDPSELPQIMVDEKMKASGSGSGEVRSAGMTEAELLEREMSLPIEVEKTYKHEIDYRNKLVLAPMVRSGTCRCRSDPFLNKKWTGS
jgi:tRNA-dihydrouridine synthase 2